MLIVHPLGDGIAIIHPTGEVLIEELARKDVPAGVPYLIVADETVPDDRTFRGAWTADFSSPDGTGIGAEAWHAEQEQLRAAERARVAEEERQAEIARQAEEDRQEAERAALAIAEQAEPEDAA